MHPALRFALRDLGIAAVTGAVLWLDAGARAEGDSPWPLGVAAGLLCALCGFLLHEWGHLAGARAAGARVSFPPRLQSPFLFLFDVVHNGPREFLAMSYGGYAGSALGLALLWAVLHREALSGRVGLGSAALGVLATLVLELPTTLRVRRGEPLPSAGPAYVRGDEPGA